jgi:sarcosine oxidase subunit alpha
MRIDQPDSGRVPTRRGTPVTVQINDQAVTAFAGETIAAVLLVEGQRIFRHTRKTNEPRSLFCGMGICYDCLVTVDNMPNIRACVTQIREGMVIQTRSEIR